MSKKIVCRCEDVTEEELIHAVKDGYDDIELLKRHTGVSTGPCEGKTCLYHSIRLLNQMKKQKPEEMRLPTSRPPLDPVPIRLLAGDKEQ